MVLCRNDTQYNGTQNKGLIWDTNHKWDSAVMTQHNGTQNKGLIWDTKHKRHSEVMPFSITTLSMMALRIKGIFGTLSINGTLQK
jgi:hypothetical protein